MSAVGHIIAVGAAISAFGYWLFGQKKPKDGFSVNPKRYDKEVRSGFSAAKTALQRINWQFKGWSVGLVNVVQGTHLVGGHWCVWHNGMWVRGWKQKRELGLVANPDGSLDRRPVVHEAGHAFLDSHKQPYDHEAQNNEWQHNIMRAAGIY